MNKVFVITRRLTPVAVCSTEEQANQIIETVTSDAGKALEQLKAELLEPHRPEGNLGPCCNQQVDEYQFLGRTGYYYKSAEEAEYFSLEDEFYAREDVVELKHKCSDKYNVTEVDSYM